MFFRSCLEIKNYLMTTPSRYDDVARYVAEHMSHFIQDSAGFPYLISTFIHVPECQTAMLNCLAENDLLSWDSSAARLVFKSMPNRETPLYRSALEHFSSSMMESITKELSDAEKRNAPWGVFIDKLEGFLPLLDEPRKQKIITWFLEDKLLFCFNSKEEASCIIRTLKTSQSTKQIIEAMLNKAHHYSDKNLTHIASSMSELFSEDLEKFCEEALEPGVIKKLLENPLFRKLWTSPLGIGDVKFFRDIYSAFPLPTQPLTQLLLPEGETKAGPRDYCRLNTLIIRLAMECSRPENTKRFTLTRIMRSYSSMPSVRNSIFLLYSIMRN